MSYDVQFARQSLSALFDLKGQPEAIESWVKDLLPSLPKQPNTRIGQEGAELYHVGRNHWIVRTGLNREQEYEERLKPADCPEDISIVRISDTLTFFRVAGPEAADVMAIACPLDLNETIFGPDDVTYSEVFGLKALVTRCDGGFELAVEQSFGDMIEDYLARATA